MDFGYPPEGLEQQIIAKEAGIDADRAAALALLGSRVRNLDQQNLLEGPSTRLLIYAGALMRRGVAPRRACDIAIVQAMTDDELLQKGIYQVVEAIF
jgi:nitric oxide reductase NorQ protein